jgi:chemotaxis protein methyltransferase CheR
MEPLVFQRLCSIAHETAGIHLDESKHPMVEARVAKRLRALSLPTEQAYLTHLEQDASGGELMHFLDAISTNFTDFFRESIHFQILRDRLRSQWAATESEIRIWCAAAATGEEAYSIAFTAMEALQGTGIGFRLLATDISTRALGVAKAGEYDDSRIAPVPKEQRRRFLTVHRSASGERVHCVSDEIRRRITFGRLNLNRPPYPMRGPFHAVFCRNVMIYFQNPTRSALVAETERLLIPGGLLFTGHAETLTGLTTRLRVVRPSIYVLPPAAEGIQTPPEGGSRSEPDALISPASAARARSSS